MTPLDGPLSDLVRKLDALGSAPSLLGLAQALEATPLAPQDVAPYIQTNSQSYNRATVVLREQYELLVMTWLAGQASAPHDHTGSICAMRVVQGEAVEGCYRIADDGFVDLEYESVVRTGEVTAGQDAGVHTVRNPADGDRILVTVHVYAPPLRDFRRFVARPQQSARDSAASENVPTTIVVVGGGFSGSIAAAQILQRAASVSLAMRVVVVERRGAIGEGLAYGTREPAHLLNVPAGRMSAWPDRPNDFVEWASQRYQAVLPGDFLPRQWYGEYVRETLLTAGRDSAGKSDLSIVLDEVRRIARHPTGGWMVHLARGVSLRAAAVVLAVGHRPPSDPLATKWRGPRTRFIADPWRQFAMNAVAAAEPVAVLGSGLTAADAVLSLAGSGQQAPITLISRRGLAPQAHASVPVSPANLDAWVSGLLAAPGGLRLQTLAREFRRVVRESTSMGGDWRSVVDGLRPHTAGLWQALSVADRRRFLLRLRPFWEVHRHRMAPSVAQRFNELIDSGGVRIVAGRVETAEAQPDGVRLVIVERNGQGSTELNVNWVINCTGPVPTNSVESNPAIGSLLVYGLLSPDELSLGIETTADGNAVDAQGRKVPDLFVVGTLRKPASWESTAVPELRSQAASVAQRVVDAITRGRDETLRQYLAESLPCNVGASQAAVSQPVVADPIRSVESISFQPYRSATWVI
ncbi:MAG TPA: FAD/NAD(P)-binding protein [Pirellulales bacterium]|jgi:uncharacterized NAD(P)/FAD-binding protein YdhS/predicted metal-dependent enzyme (double-stranded beta helix superfamily)|nr:FAD/NAD(P)-binding protein [Pirellulales bacterium]